MPDEADNAAATYSEAFKVKSKVKITGKNPCNGNTKDVVVAVPLKYLNNSGRFFEMSLEIKIKLISV